MAVKQKKLILEGCQIALNYKRGFADRWRRLLKIIYPYVIELSQLVVTIESEVG